MNTKAFPAKAAAGEAGEFTALVSVFGNVDRGGEMVMPGAFSSTLVERGLPPVYYSHQWATPPIGATTKAEETEAGLEIEARLFVDVSERARECHEAMRAGVLREFSFAYDVIESKEETVDGEVIVQLHELDLYEVGPTLVGMNPDTELIGVRSGLWLPAGRTKRAIPFRESQKAPADTAWDAAHEIALADVNDLYAMCAWVDTKAEDIDGDGLPDAKSAYRLPHHRASDGHPVVWRGVASAMGAFLGGRGGVDLPSSDRPAVYKHLARHFEQFDREPPELRSYEPGELASLFVDDEGAIDPRARGLLLARPR